MMKSRNEDVYFALIEVLIENHFAKIKIIFDILIIF